MPSDPDDKSNLGLLVAMLVFAALMILVYGCKGSGAIEQYQNCMKCGVKVK